MKNTINLFVVMFASLFLSSAVSAEKSSPAGVSADAKGSVTLKGLRANGFAVWGRSNTKTDTRHWLTMKKAYDFYVCDRTTAQGASNKCVKLQWGSKNPNPVSLLKSGYKFAGQTTPKRQSNLEGDSHGASAVTLHFESKKLNKYIYCDFSASNGAQTKCLTRRL